ncbi:hypothetical protein BG005_010498 [Podila minutissima]|nr:hypothetical protein BG005_010498 [Podila minutissima]
MATRDNDSFREWMSGFGSGLEHLWDALQHEYDSKTRNSALALSFRCLALHTVLSTITYVVPNSLCITFNQLFYPTVLFFRYLDPDPWDHLFMSTVRSLGCSERSDIVAKPGPRYFIQLKQYARRTLKAYFAIGTIHHLVHRTGVFSIPSIGLGLIAVHQFLRHRGVNRAFLKLCVAVVVVGPRWPVWAVQVFALQQLFMYELLQPYLARVQFKGWEERAWLAQHEIELQGFAFGAWLLCSVPWVGVAAIPFMFPAVAFLLTRSCGLMESSGQGVSGDVIEKRSPGVKTVALGTSQSVEGDWEAAKVKTHLRNTKLEVHSPSKHNKADEGHYLCDRGMQTELTEEQIAADRARSKTRKQELYRAEALTHAHPPEEFSVPSRPPETDVPFIPDWNSPMPHIPFGRPDLLFSANPSSSSSSSRSILTGTSSSNEQATTRSEREVQENLTKYNFSDRKTDETAPSAPPSGILDDSRSWADSGHGDSAFRVESATTSDEVDGRSTGQEKRSQASKVRAQEDQLRAHEQRIRAQEDSLRDEDRARAKEQRARAKEQRAHAAEQRRHAEEMRRGKHRARDGPPRRSRWGTIDVFHVPDPNSEDEEDKEDEENEEEEAEEAAEAWENEYESDEDEHHDGDWNKYSGNRLERLQNWPVREGSFGRGWGRGGRGDYRHMGRWPPRGPRGARGARGSRGDREPRGRYHQGYGRSGSHRDVVEDESPVKGSSNSSKTQLSDPFGTGLSAVIAENMLNVEEHINQRMESWGRQWAQKLNEAIPKPNGASGK